MTTFLVTRILDPAGTFRAAPLSFGDVELRPPSLDTPLEKEALVRSKTSFGTTFDVNSVAMRISTLVEAESIKEAEEKARVRFEEVQDVLDHSSAVTGLGKFVLADCGFTRDLETGELEPRSPRTSEGVGPLTSFFVVEDLFPAIDHAQYFWSKAKSELKDALFRAYYWSRKARWESDAQLRVLFRWFAMEAVCLVDRDEDITPKLMWCVGYPSGDKTELVSRSLLAELKSNPEYKIWRTPIRKRLEEIRRFRNRSVHDGFRPQDISPVQLQSFDLLTDLVSPRVQGYARDGVYKGMRSPKELFEYLPLLFNEHVSPRDVFGNFLYRMAHP